MLVGSREMRALGVESAYSVVDLVGEERALGAPAEALAELADADRPDLVALRRPAYAGLATGTMRGITADVRPLEL